MTREEIINMFTYHSGCKEQLPLWKNVNQAIQQAAFVLIESCPDSQELTLAIQDLQRARMMANAAIALHYKPQESAND